MDMFSTRLHDVGYDADPGGVSGNDHGHSLTVRRPVVVVQVGQT